MKVWVESCARPWRQPFLRFGAIYEIPGGLVQVLDRRTCPPVDLEFNPPVSFCRLEIVSTPSAPDFHIFQTCETNWLP